MSSINAAKVVFSSFYIMLESVINDNMIYNAYFSVRQ